MVCLGILAGMSVTDLLYRKVSGEPELGYMIDVLHQRKGYAAEVCLAVIDYAWDFLLFDKLNCLIQKGNTASECLAEKLGFTFQEEMDLDGKCMKRYTISKSGA